MSQSWQEYAACIGTDPELFFDKYEADKSKDGVVRNNVKALCMSCPVRQQCLETAEENGLTGLFGGVWFNGGKMTDK